jgi:hypothetical protein
MADDSVVCRGSNNPILNNGKLDRGSHLHLHFPNCFSATAKQSLLVRDLLVVGIGICVGES